MHRATAVIDHLFAEFNRLFIPILLHHIMILLNVIQVLAKNVLQLKRKSLSVRQRSDVASSQLRNLSSSTFALGNDPQSSVAVSHLKIFPLWNIFKTLLNFLQLLLLKTILDGDVSISRKTKNYGICLMENISWNSKIVRSKLLRRPPDKNGAAGSGCCPTLSCLAL